MLPVKYTKFIGSAPHHATEAHMSSYNVGEIHPLMTSIGNNMLGTCPGRIIEVRDDGTMVMEAIGLARATRHVRTVADMVQAAKWDRDLQEEIGRAHV